MPYKRAGTMLIVLVLLAATVTVLASCSQPTPTAEVPEGDIAPTADEMAPGEAQEEEDYPAPEEESEAPSIQEEESYPPPPTSTPTLPPGYLGPDEAPEETPEPEE